jgi:hypothetical protein
MRGLRCAAHRDRRRTVGPHRRNPVAPQLNEKTTGFMLPCTVDRLRVTLRASSSCNAAHK